MKMTFTSPQEIRNRARKLRESGFIETSIEGYAAADKIEADQLIQSLDGFNKLVDWLIKDMTGGCYIEGGYPPSRKWLLSESEKRGYKGEAMDCLKSIIAGNGYQYV